jgi:hypothetical protein
MNAMLRMDAVGRVGYGEKVIINMDHVVNIEEKIGVMDRRTCIIHTIDGRAIEVNETLNDIWEFMNNLRKSNPDKMSDKPHCFDPDKRVEHVM